VRQECENLAGKRSTARDKQQRVSLLQKLEKEQKRVHSKVMLFTLHPFAQLFLTCNLIRLHMPEFTLVIIQNTISIVVGCQWQI